MTGTVNTVFPLTEVVVEVASARCATGTKIRRDMLVALKATHTVDEWYPIEGKWYKKFIKHTNDCPACLQYEQSRGRML